MASDDRPLLPARLAIRRRPAMYLGDTRLCGLHGVLDDAVCLCLESFHHGYSRRIDVTLCPDGSMELGCDGPGFLTGEERLGEAGLAYAFCGAPHTPGVPAAWGRPYFGGWHCGLLALGSLGTYLEALSRRDGVTERVRLERGEPAPPQPLTPLSEEYGTYLRWLPDPEIFAPTTWELEPLAARLQTLACLMPGIEIRLADLRSGEHRHYYHPDGVADLVSLRGAGRDALHPPVRLEHRGEWGEFSIGLQYRLAAPGCTPPGEVFSFANCRETRDGVHLTAFRNALLEMISQVATEESIMPAGTVPMNWKVVSACLRAVISVVLDSPYFAGSFRSHLANHELQEPLRRAISLELERSRAEFPERWRKIARQVVYAG